MTCGWAPWSLQFFEASRFYEPLINKVLDQECVNKHVLIGHLDEAVALFPQAAHYAKDWDKWLHTCVLLRPNVYDGVGQADGGSCAANACRTVNHSFFVCIWLQNPIDEGLQHFSKRFHCLIFRHVVVRPPNVVQLGDYLVFAAMSLVIKKEAALQKMRTDLFLVLQHNCCPLVEPRNRWIFHGPKLFALFYTLLHDVASGDNEAYPLLRHHSPEVFDGVRFRTLGCDYFSVLG